MTAITRLLGLAAGALLCAGLTGCMSTSPVWDAHFGESVRTVRMLQTLNPNASYTNTDPVSGVDGRAATYSMDRYGQSFRNPPTDGNTFVIGIGNGTGMGGGSQ
ncbi:MULTISPECIES: hypothetical protein [unclassified Cupriavidus]|uniref:hypothetical protein n=1 Tax=unclassified Cupriavidus TaxID=2640874 RepID=UPI001C001A3D|nr:MULTISPECIES: hypothetical protein [unclassified Cupriavidus]MCA3192955.1 hypothetical protein [Cupriavidus sp.]MCA3195807.1 hypothetical protein [Cupriavidus sp.]MCA3204708.1 hypothetical protein [Cupriavidus sp.]MCA3206840.1 hypothetical protein [Cupriavidus sp.]QWE94985.1 hypothetical protein KLP38_03130 [Cupriavidus sp. EM10]